MENPYSPPTAESDLASASAFTSPKLYSATHVGWATFLGSAMAGSILMALNYYRMGRAGKGHLSLVMGAVCTIALMAFSFSLPDDFPGLSLPLSLTVTFLGYVTAKSLQKREVDDRIINGQGQYASGWAVVGIGLGSSVVTGAILFGIIILLFPY